MEWGCNGQEEGPGDHAHARTLNHPPGHDQAACTWPIGDNAKRVWSILLNWNFKRVRMCIHTATHPGKMSTRFSFCSAHVNSPPVWPPRAASKAKGLLECQPRPQWGPTRSSSAAVFFAGHGYHRCTYSHGRWDLTQLSSQTPHGKTDVQQPRPLPS